MSKEEEINTAVDRLVMKGMDEETARKNLLECDKYFIDELTNILR